MSNSWHAGLAQALPTCIVYGILGRVTGGCHASGVLHNGDQAWSSALAVDSFTIDHRRPFVGGACEMALIIDLPNI